MSDKRRASPPKPEANNAGGYYRHVDARVTPCHRQHAPSVRYEANHLHSQEPVGWRFRQPEAALFWWETGFQRYDLDVDGELTRADQASLGPFGLIPPEFSVKGEHHIGELCTYHVIFIDADFLEERGKILLDRPLIGFSDVGLRRSISEFSQWKDDATFPLIAEGWALQAIARLRLMMRFSPIKPVANGGLTGAVLRKVKEYINGALHEGIGLVELAELADLSVRHFSRAFLASTGQTPARFVHERRLEQGKEMLALERLTITDVAFACGFSHAQHFTNSFKRSTGMTPSDYRNRMLR